jgi:TatD DNase family protein
MRFIDTHAHLYLDQFDSDRASMIESAINKGVDTFLLPNIDQESIKPMLQLCDDYPGHCHAMMGLHPTSVGADFEHQLAAH